MGLQIQTEAEVQVAGCTAMRNLRSEPGCLPEVPYLSHLFPQYGEFRTDPGSQEGKLVGPVLERIENHVE